MINDDIKQKIKKWPLHWALGGQDFTGGLEQNFFELENFCQFLIEKKIKSYVEVGIAAGYLLKFMRDDMNLQVTGITLEKRDTHIGLPVIYGNSRDIQIISSAKNADIYFIDGDHSYEAVSSDFKNYRDKCIYMAFHDILGLRSCEGVNKFWEENKINYDYWEFIDPNLNNASGIGVIKIR